MRVFYLLDLLVHENQGADALITLIGTVYDETQEKIVSFSKTHPPFFMEISSHQCVPVAAAFCHCKRTHSTMRIPNRSIPLTKSLTRMVAVAIRATEAAAVQCVWHLQEVCHVTPDGSVYLCTSLWSIWVANFAKRHLPQWEILNPSAPQAPSLTHLCIATPCHHRDYITQLKVDCIHVSKTHLTLTRLTYYFLMGVEIFS